MDGDREAASIACTNIDVRALRTSISDLAVGGGGRPGHLAIAKVRRCLDENIIPTKLSLTFYSTTRQSISPLQRHTQRGFPENNLRTQGL